MGAYDAVIEIPRGSRVKYEVDHGTGRVFLDRVLFTPMGYPADYGFFENTLGEDGDPLDVLVLLDVTLFPGVMANVRPVGVLKMKRRGRRRRQARGRAHQGPALEPHPGSRRRPRLHEEGDRALLRALQGPRAEQVGQGRLVGRQAPRRTASSTRRSSASPSTRARPRRRVRAKLPRPSDVSLRRRMPRPRASSAFCVRTAEAADDQSQTPRSAMNDSGFGGASVDVDLEVQVAAERVARAARRRDELAGADPLSVADVEAAAGDVRVPGRDAAAVVDLDVVAVAAVVAGVDHDCRTARRICPTSSPVRGRCPRDSRWSSSRCRTARSAVRSPRCIPPDPGLAHPVPLTAPPPPPPLPPPPPPPPPPTRLPPRRLPPAPQHAVRPQRGGPLDASPRRSGRPRRPPGNRRSSWRWCPAARRAGPRASRGSRSAASSAA